MQKIISKLSIVAFTALSINASNDTSFVGVDSHDKYYTHIIPYAPGVIGLSKEAYNNICSHFQGRQVYIGFSELGPKCNQYLIIDTFDDDTYSLAKQKANLYAPNIPKKYLEISLKGVRYTD